MMKSLVPFTQALLAAFEEWLFSDQKRVKPVHSTSPSVTVPINLLMPLLLPTLTQSTLQELWRRS